MARPKIKFDEDRIGDLAYRGASNREIAALVGCDDKTLGNRFSALLTKKRAERRTEIREWQTREAKAGNTALLIWLGKVELDQTEKPTPQKTEVTVNYVNRTIDGEPAKAAQEPDEDSE